MTLMELLVAMLIFVSIMSGVAALFANASRSVSQANIAIDGYDRARSTMTRLELDLTTAFASRDVGEKYKFYGQGNGFCYIGWTEGGKLARITYQLRDAGAYFTTEIMDTVEKYLIRAMNKDLLTSDNTVDPPTTLALIFYLVRKEEFDFATGEAWKDWARKCMKEKSLVGYAQMGNPLLTDSASIRISLPVSIYTASLTRYQENDIRDLLTFPEMTAPTEFGWPVIDPIWNGSEESYINGDYALYFDVHNTLFWGGLADMDQTFPTLPRRADPPLQFNQPIERDLRSILSSIDPNDPNTRVPIVLGSSTVQTIVRSNLCEQWLKKIHWVLGRSTSSIAAFNDKVSQYDLVDGIVRQVLIGDSANTSFELALKEFDVFKDYDGWGIDPFYGELTPSLFYYTNGDYKNATPIRKPYFNTRFNIPGYAGFFAGKDVDAVAAVNAFDCALSCGSVRPGEVACDSVASDCEGLNFGSPLDPRLPYAVEVNFWIAIDSGRISGSEFFRQFRRVIDIPSGFTRQD